MRILIIHSFYQQTGGEDTVMKQEADRLSFDNDVEILSLYNQSGLKGALQFIMSIWNTSAKRLVSSRIDSFKPDVIHIHNLHFAFGPIVIRVAKKLGIPVVITVHNYRLLCPSAILMHEGSLYLESLSVDFPWDAVKNGVYRGSVFQTFWLAFVIWFHKKIGTWQMVSRYLFLTEFSRDLHFKSNLMLPANKLLVKSNFSEAPNLPINREEHFLFVGRLTAEKGLFPLIEVFKQNGLPLHIAGDGLLKEMIEQTTKTHDNIHYIGSLNHDQVLEEMAKCSALIFPSIWYEGMPMTIIESFSLGNIVIASNIGAMKSMVEDGLNGQLFEVADAQSLQEKIIYWNNLSKIEKDNMRFNAKRTYDELYSPKENLIHLNNIYKIVVDESEKGSN